MTIEQKKSKIGLYVDGVVDSSIQGRFIGACTTIPVIPDDEKADYAGMVILYTGSKTGYTANTYYKYSGTAWEKYVPADVANKVDKVSGKGLSTEDFTTVLKDKLVGIDLSNYATTSALNTGLANKVDKDGNKVLSTNDFTDTLKTKLEGIDLSKYALKTEIPTDYVPNTRKVNNKALSSDISLSASDVGAVPTTRTVNGKALSSNITLTASNVGALPSTTTVTNVSFASDTTANVYPILMKGSTGATTTASGTKFNTGITITPSTGTVTATAFKGNLDGIATSATTASNYATTGTIKEALDSKQATITGGATSITSSDLTASRALISNANGKVAVSAVTSTELGYLDGVTSAIQTQLNGKQAKIISASGISVPASAWATGHADGDFIYRASITLSGCTASMIPAVVFSTTNAISGDYSPVCESGAGVIYIWSKKNVAISVLTALAIPQ